MNISVVSSQSDWNNALKRIGFYDFSHTWDFHNLSRYRGEGEPLLYLDINDLGEIAAAWPVLKRPIPNTEHFDYGSAYGYCGPLFTKSADIVACSVRILEAMTRDGAVSVVSRMHPLLSPKISELIGSVQAGSVVAIDIDQQPFDVSSYRKGHRYDLDKAARSGVVVRHLDEMEGAAIFSHIYLRAMDDLKAADYYKFDIEYIRRFLACKEFDAWVCAAYLGDLPISAAIFVECSGIMQYFLSGTLVDSRKIASSKMLIAYAHKVATERDFGGLILGGGLGGGGGPLLDFKRGFSNNLLDFCLVRKVLNQSVYEALAGDLAVRSTSYFPAYRTAA